MLWNYQALCWKVEIKNSYRNPVTVTVHYSLANDQTRTLNSGETQDIEYGAWCITGVDINGVNYESDWHCSHHAVIIDVNGNVKLISRVVFK
jgi:hypothetical protein